MEKTPKCIYFKNLDECACNNDPDDYGECLYEDGRKVPNAQIECHYYKPSGGSKIEEQRQKFLNHKACEISFSDFIELMYELLDDASLVIEKEYPVLSIYSQNADCCYDDVEIMERVGDFLGIDITACFMYTDLEIIFFIYDELEENK